MRRSSLVGRPHVQMVLRENATVLKYRRYSGVYTPTPVDLSGCKHQTTICIACFGDWEADYVIAPFQEHGVTGYRSYGCRCTVCKDATSAARNA